MTGETEQALRYHEATKHHFHRSARSLGFMDWDNQPNPFRRYAGAELAPLPFGDAADSPAYEALYTPGAIAPRPLTVQTLGAFFACSLGLSAWKEYAGTRWELRCNPSSGNLHPTEGYLVAGPVPGWQNVPGVYHYAPEEHGMERRARFSPETWRKLAGPFPGLRFFVGLSSVQWREIWKYGERAYRYCNHDVGHALAALSYAGAMLGWRVLWLDAPGDAELAVLLGQDRAGDFDNAEHEHPDVLAAVVPADADSPVPNTVASEDMAMMAGAEWTGRANRLSAEHMHWEIIDAVNAACRKPPTPVRLVAPLHHAAAAESTDAGPTARDVILQRRSAVEMDGATGIAAEQFFHMLGRCLPGTSGPPFWSLPPECHVHLLLFVHRVRGIQPGLYFLVRDSRDAPGLREATRGELAWQHVAASGELPLYLLDAGDCRRLAAQLCCQQAIAGDGAFSVGMVARFEEPIARDGAWRYPRLFWEAGAIGQVLYLEAEVNNVRGTGIGCYFDDPVHEVLGLRDRRFQSLYHFTVGGAVDDPRLRSLPPYAEERLTTPEPRDAVTGD